MSPKKKHYKKYGIHHKLHPDSMMELFTIQLNNIFSIKHCLLECLPTFAPNISYTNFKHAIFEDLEDIEVQLNRLKEIFNMFGKKYDVQKCDDVKAITYQIQKAIQSSKNADIEAELAVLFDLVALEGMEIVSYSILYELAESMGDADALLLIRQNQDMVKENKELFESIIHEYVIFKMIKKDNEI